MSTFWREVGPEHPQAAEIVPPGAHTPGPHCPCEPGVVLSLQAVYGSSDIIETWIHREQGEQS